MCPHEKCVAPNCNRQVERERHTHTRKEMSVTFEYDSIKIQIDKFSLYFAHIISMLIHGINHLPSILHDYSVQLKYTT